MNPIVVALEGLKLNFFKWAALPKALRNLFNDDKSPSLIELNTSERVDERKLLCKGYIACSRKRDESDLTVAELKRHKL